MPNRQHVDIIKSGVDVWNKWKNDNYKAKVDLKNSSLKGANLCRVNLKGANLCRANLKGANLSEANLRGANLSKANLGGANFRGADLYVADLRGADLSESNLSEVNLRRANLSVANLRGANLSGANLRQATFVKTILEKANLTDCYIYGISAWDIKLNEETIQLDLVITPESTPKITVDNIEVAQFIYLLLNNKRIRHVIDTITSKVVLILGRFTPDRKAVLDAIREKIREYDYSPVVFDFEKPKSRNFIETVSILAHMARFVIADFTDPKIVLEEVPHIVRNVTVPVIPLLLNGSDEPSTLYNLRRNHKSLLETYSYRNTDDLLKAFKEKVINPAERKAKELEN